MYRLGLASLLMIVGSAVSSNAGVFILSDGGIDIPGVAGFRTYQLTAYSSDYPIVAVDFAGDGSTSGPGAKGFFGSMSQVELFGGGLPTVFSDNNAIVDIVTPYGSLADSHFLVNSSTVVVPPGLAKESGLYLQGAWRWQVSPGLSVPVAQLVLPMPPPVVLTYNGVITVDRNGEYIEIPVSGGIFPPDIFAPMVNDVSAQATTLGDVISLTPFDADGTPPVAWSELAGPTYTPGFGAPGDAPGLGPATWSWDPFTQAFQFNTLGSTPGIYVWTGSASNVLGSDNFSISVDVLLEPDTNVPEPISAVLACFAAFSSSVFVRTRRE